MPGNIKSDTLKHGELKRTAISPRPNGRQVSPISLMVCLSDKARGHVCDILKVVGSAELFLWVLRLAGEPMMHWAFKEATQQPFWNFHCPFNVCIV